MGEMEALVAQLVPMMVDAVDDRNCLSLLLLAGEIGSAKLRIKCMGVVLRGLPAVKADASSGWAELPAAMQEQLRQLHGIGKSFGFDFDDCDGRMVLAVLKESLALQKDRYQEAATLHA